MKKITQNPPLTYDALLNISDGCGCSLLISQTLFRAARELSIALFQNFCEKDESVLMNEKKLFDKFDMGIYTFPQFKESEWIFVTPKDIFYSKGDNTN